MIKSSIAIARFVCAPAISGSEITITRAKTRTTGLWILSSDIIFQYRMFLFWFSPHFYSESWELCRGRVPLPLGEGGRRPGEGR